MASVVLQVLSGNCLYYKVSSKLFSLLYEVIKADIDFFENSFKYTFCSEREIRLFRPLISSAEAMKPVLYYIF